MTSPSPDLSAFILVDCPLRPEELGDDAPVKRQLLITRVCDLSQLGADAQNDDARLIATRAALAAATAQPRVEGEAPQQTTPEELAALMLAHEHAIRSMACAVVQGHVDTYDDGELVITPYRLYRGPPVEDRHPVAALPQAVCVRIYEEVQALLKSFRLPVARRNRRA